MFVSLRQRLAPYANSIEEDNAQFQELQSGISNYLDGNSSSTANPMYAQVALLVKE